MNYPYFKAYLLVLVVGLMIFSNAAKAASRPNILFCIMDDASYMHMSAYGCEWMETPGFDRLAEEGILFQNAYTPNAKRALFAIEHIDGAQFLAAGRSGQPHSQFSRQVQNLPGGSPGEWLPNGADGQKGWGPGEPGKIGWETTGADRQGDCFGQVA